MSKIKIFRGSVLLTAALALTACNPPNFSKLQPDFGAMKKIPASLLNFGNSSGDLQIMDTKTVAANGQLPMGAILENSLANRNQGSNFVNTLTFALNSDPDIVKKRHTIEAQSAAIGVAKAQKDFQVGTTLYGGIEDVTDNTKGLAVSINASRLIYDGGELDAKIASSLFALEAAKFDLTATLDRRAYELCSKWLDLEMYKSLQEQVERRLAVLEPLIDQLEKVAKAGIGDVSRVTAAQRTVTTIKAEKMVIAEGLAQAQLEFSNAFGAIDNAIAFDYDFISNLVPEEIDDKMIQKSPLLKSQYASYQSAIAKVVSLKAKDGFDVGFEARAMRPFAGSDYSSDESFGLVGRKTLFNGHMLVSEIKEAEALVEAGIAQMQASYRLGARSVQAAMQNISSMERAILIARENAKLTSDEIIYLKQQLIIGGSTIDSVLSAEARLYDAESREIKLQTEKYKSQLVIASSLGLLSGSIGL